MNKLHSFCEKMVTLDVYRKSEECQILEKVPRCSNSQSTFPSKFKVLQTY